MVQLVKRASDVRIQEINLSQIILSASSSTAGIVIVSSQGSTEPRHFSNPTDFMFEYGNPDPSVSMTIQSALNYFSEGNDLWAVRAVGSGFLTSCVLMYSDGGVTGLRSVGLANPADTDLDTLVSGSEEAIALFYASRGPGSYGSRYAIKIDDRNVNPVMGGTAVSSNTGGSLANAAYSYRVAAIGTAGEAEASASIGLVVSGLASATGVNTLTWSAVTGAIGYKVYGRVAGGTYGLLATVGGGTLTFADTGGVTPDTASQPVLNPLNAPSTNEFIVSVYDLDNLEIGALQEYTCTLTPKVDGSGTQMELEDRINPFSDYLQVVNNVAGLVTVPKVTSVARTALGGGTSGTAPTSFNVANSFNKFANKQLYRISMFINGGVADPIVQKAMDTLAVSRGDSVALLDVPSISQKYQAAIDYRNLSLNLNSTYSALFTADLLQADLVNGKQVYNPPSSWAAALCARTDRVANPAFSIAGLNRGLLNVLKTRYNYDDGQATALYNASVNYSRTFVGQGIALWEQRTLAGADSALSWLSVRRIVNVIKVALYSFLLYALQEMNTDAVRRQLVNSCKSYLDSIRSADGLYDFDVICDNSNNTPATANAGVLVLTVILIPNIPIHEIQLQVVISKQGISFKETLSQVTGT